MLSIPCPSSTTALMFFFVHPHEFGFLGADHRVCSHVLEMSAKSSTKARPSKVVFIFHAMSVPTCSTVIFNTKSKQEKTVLRKVCSIRKLSVIFNTHCITKRNWNPDMLHPCLIADFTIHYQPPQTALVLLVNMTCTSLTIFGGIS